MDYSEKLYLFVLMPPQDLSDAIQEQRIAFAEKYGFVKGLKPPVHVSLTEVFRIPLEKINEFEQQTAKLQQWADYQTPFSIELKNFNFFDHPNQRPVLYIDMVKTDALAKLQKELIKELKRFPLVKLENTGFTPHFTIGYRDIPKTVFPEIKEAYSKKRFQGSFECTTVYLWKHEFGKWQVIRQFELKGLKPKEEQLELF